jgi:hypothetical protein
VSGPSAKAEMAERRAIIAAEQQSNLRPGSMADVSAMTEFRGAHGRMPTLVLSERGEDRRAQDQSKRNTPLCLVRTEGSRPTEVSTSDAGFPVYLPTLRQRMASLP